MIAMVAFMASIFAEFPQWNEEFEPFKEMFEEVPAMWKIIAPQENREELIFQVCKRRHALYISQPEIEAVLLPYIEKGAVVVDYEMGLGPFLCDRVTPEGQVYIFESCPERFADRFWELSRCRASNAQLYCSTLQGFEFPLEHPLIQGVSALCISLSGGEGWVFQGIERLIVRDRPLLLLHITGGIESDQGDRFVREELQRRFEELGRWQYRVRHLRGNLYLALPL